MLIKSKLERRFEELPVESHNTANRSSVEAEKSKARRLRRNRRISDGLRSGSGGWSVRMF